MTFKKNNPGCPCDCGETPPTGPCGCNATQIVIDFTYVQDVAKIFGVRFSPGPCDTLDFEGFSALEGTYYVDWPTTTPVEIELARVAATNNPQYDALGNAYCLYGFITLTVPYLGDDCLGLLCLCIRQVTWLAEDFVECTPLEELENSDGFCLGVGAGSTTYSVYCIPLALCVADNGDVTFDTTDAIDCPTETFNWQASWNPVL